MPTYKITDPRTGKVLRVTGDSPPTEAELTQIFDGVTSTTPPPTAAAVMVGGQPMDIGTYNRTQQTPRPGSREWVDSQAATDRQRVRDQRGGTAAGISNTVYGLGDLARRGTGMERIINTPAVQAEITPPNTPAGRAAFTGEQIGEFFLPTGVAGKAGIAAEAAKSGLLTLGQGGTSKEAALSAGLSAAIPAIGAAAQAPLTQKLAASAEKTMADSLRATKEWAKTEAERLAPEMLKRGVGGSIAKLRTWSTDVAARVGQNLAKAYDDATKAGGTVPRDIVLGNVQLAKDALFTPDKNGRLIPIPGYATAIAKLEELETFLGELADDIPLNQAAGLKQAFDDIADVAGLFGPKAGASASEKKEAWAFLQASTNFRELLNQNPTIASLNEAASFWIGLRNVVKATKLRKVGQTGGIMAAGGAGVGAVLGGTTGDSTSEKALYGLLGAAGGRQLVRLVQSPAFMNQVSGPMKQELADALASQNAGRIGAVVTRITAALPRQASPNANRQADREARVE